MSAKTKPVIAVFAGPQGHLSIATAIIESLQLKYQIIEYHFIEDSLFKAYLPVYRLFPVAFQVPYKLTKQKAIIKFVHGFFLSKYQTSIQKFISQHQPEICINTFFMFSPALEAICQDHQIPLINVLADPKTFHPTSLAEHATVNLCFDKTTQKIAKKFNRKARCAPVGWFVREKFETHYDKSLVRKKLQLSPDQLTFLIASGSEGTSLVLKILPAFMKTKIPVQVIVACGNNLPLYHLVSGMKNTAQKANALVHIIPLKFTKQLHQYMQAADLVIGKAGPNTLFESVATLTPFFALTHIAGQEDGNLDIIKEYQLGYVEERPLKAIKLIQQILTNPTELKKFTKPIQSLAQTNKRSKEQLQFLVEKLLEKI